MHPDRIAERLKEFQTLCRRRRVPFTAQRRAVLQAVLERNDHPTADQILEVVRNRVHGLSRTTVYRVLDLLVDWGLVRRLPHPGASARFDGRIRRHHHLICKKCNKVIDLENARLDKLSLPNVGSEGFEIEDYSVQFLGTCAACRQAETQ